ncbi:ABC transporter ATP-binding protein/permease [Irregularibacter muris]|uniref:ABC transporter ATP-binding protein/permease n=1 Tax=Irregularibacter muris TaxID=1796619 RepID=A0AAE3HG56_9FIRM|nr:ABC transporter ATP-binding protein [Irregularibacter muris]MCR1898498.1 ABC transporter ATP-binding protein/permease [Irregularibacter muris]
MKLLGSISKIKLLFLFIFALVVGFLSMLPMIFLQRTIDFSVHNKHLGKVLSNGLAYIGIYVLSYTLRLLILNEANKANNKIKQNIRDQMFEGISETKIPMIEQMGKNNLINSGLDNLKELEEDILITTVQFIFTLSSFITGIGIMARYSVKLLLIIIPLSIISTFIINLSSRKSSSLAEKASQIRTKTWSAFTENILGHREIYLYNQQERLSTEYVDWSSSWNKVENQRLRIENRSAITANLSFSIFIGIIIILGTNAIMHNNLSVGALVAILMYNHMITDPVFDLLQNQRKVFKIITASKVLSRILGKLEDNKLNTQKPLEHFEKMELKNITIGYDDRSILENFNISIHRSQKILIKGRSGAGKSTLLKLFTGAYYPNSGKILLNNIPIQNVRISVGCVFQDDILFHGTIIDNIKFSNPTIDESELLKIIRIAQLEDLISDYGQTDIGDAGVRLSGGEKKRVLLARALASNAQLLLFDELSAGLDHELFEIIMKDILKNYGDKTIVFVEHKDVSSYKFDQVFNL